MYKIWYSRRRQRKSLDDFLQLIVQDQHKGAPHASEHIRPGSLEESLAAFITRDLPPAVQGAGVHDVGWGEEMHVYPHILPFSLFVHANLVAQT